MDALKDSLDGNNSICTLTQIHTHTQTLIRLQPVNGTKRTMQFRFDPKNFEMQRPNDFIFNPDLSALCNTSTIYISSSTHHLTLANDSMTEWETTSELKWENRKIPKKDRIEFEMIIIINKNCTKEAAMRMTIELRCS